MSIKKVQVGLLIENKSNYWKLKAEQKKHHSKLYFKDVWNAAHAVREFATRHDQIKVRSPLRNQSIIDWQRKQVTTGTNKIPMESFKLWIFLKFCNSNKYIAVQQAFLQWFMNHTFRDLSVSSKQDRDLLSWPLNIGGVMFNIIMPLVKMAAGSWPVLILRILMCAAFCSKHNSGTWLLYNCKYNQLPQVEYTIQTIQTMYSFYLFKFFPPQRGGFWVQRTSDSTILQCRQLDNALQS